MTFGTYKRMLLLIAEGPKVNFAVFRNKKWNNVFRNKNGTKKDLSFEVRRMRT